MINSSNQKLAKYTIKVEFLVSSNTIINTNLVNIPISINKTQKGSDNLFIGKTINIFIYDKILTGTYQQKLDNTEILRIENVSQLSTQQIEFNSNTLFDYVEIPATLNDSVSLTINDAKRLLKGTKNTSEYKGVTGLLEPLHLEAIESIKFIREISQKSISELVAYTTTMYYETPNNETNTQVQFGLFHSLFNVEFELKVFGTNYTLKVLRYGSSEILNNLSFGITINKIPSNDSSKQLYQILCKLNNVPTGVLSNVEKVKCYVNENLTKQTIYANLPVNYTLSNSVLFISDKIYSRYILFYDNNGVVSLNPNESIKLLGTQNLNNLTTFGWYHYDILNLGDAIVNNLPTGFKNVFSLNVKRISDELTCQYLYVFDSTTNVIKSFSRLRNNTTLLFSEWIEYVTSNHKHPATDINTDTTHQFVTQTQIDKWDSYQVSLSDYWNNAVAVPADLTVPALNGESRLVLSNMKIYTYLSNTNSWSPITDSKLILTITPDNIKLTINEGGPTREIILPEVTDNNPGIVPSDFHSTDWKNLFETNLNFTVQNPGTDIPGSYQKQLDYPFNLLTNSTDKIKDGTKHYLYGDNGSTFTVDISDTETNIQKTFYSVFDNQNIYSGVVKNFMFSIVPGYYLTNKINFGENKTVNIHNENGVATVHTQPEYTMTAHGYEYIIKIDNSVYNIYVIKIV